ncbi:MAG: HXXEE domain-containing protein [Actinomycetota bacterium]
MTPQRPVLGQAGIKPSSGRLWKVGYVAVTARAGDHDMTKVSSTNYGLSGRLGSCLGSDTGRPERCILHVVNIRKCAAPGIFAIHAADEYLSGFPEWATRHFGTTSRRFYATSHVLLVAGVTLAAHQHDKHPELLGAVASGFVANGLFHLRATRRFGEPSPGERTAATLMIPGGLALLVDLLGRRSLDMPGVITALLAGMLMNRAAVASLHLDMPTFEKQN